MMARSELILGLFSALACGVIGAGCDSTDEAILPPVVDTGLLTVGWTVAGSRDPALCGTYGAAEVDVAVFDSLGNAAADAVAACEDFSLSLELFEDVYSADVTMFDAAGRALTQTLTLTGLDVRAQTDLITDVDFPPGSFF